MPQKVEGLRLLEKFQQRVRKCHIMKGFFGLHVGGLILLNTYQVLPPPPSLSSLFSCFFFFSSLLSPTSIFLCQWDPFISYWNHVVIFRLNSHKFKVTDLLLCFFFFLLSNSEFVEAFKDLSTVFVLNRSNSFVFVFVFFYISFSAYLCFVTRLNWANRSTTGSNLSACQCYQQRRDGVKVDCDKALQQIKDLENNRDAVKIDWVDKISWLALKRKKVFNSILVNSG